MYGLNCALLVIRIIRNHSPTEALTKELFSMQLEIMKTAPQNSVVDHSAEPPQPEHCSLFAGKAQLVQAALGGVVVLGTTSIILALLCILKVYKRIKKARVQASAIGSTPTLDEAAQITLCALLQVTGRWHWPMGTIHC